MTRHPRPLAAMLMMAGGLVACGDDGNSDSPTTQPITQPITQPPTFPATTAVPAGIKLLVQVGTAGLPSSYVATLLVQDGVVTGGGFLDDPDDAAAAAALLDDPAIVKRLVEGEPAGQMCDMEYGGQDEGDISGYLEGVAVASKFHRSDGCGISDWETFTPLLGRPHWSGDRRVYTRDETPISVSSETVFLVELASNATTGYEWTASPADPGIVEVTDSTYIAPHTGLVGSGGWQQFTLTRRAAGTTTVRFEYRRPFEPADTPPVDTVTMAVTVTS